MSGKFIKSHFGLSLIGWLIKIPVFLIILLVLVIGFYEGRKAYWDYRVTKMCEEDGGVTVFEKVELEKNKHSNLISRGGSVIIPIFSNAKIDDPYYIVFSESILRKKNPKVRKTETKIIRRSDSKVLSLKVSYSRGGGDFPTFIAAASAFSCRNVKGINTILGKSTFTIK